MARKRSVFFDRLLSLLTPLQQMIGGRPRQGRTSRSLTLLFGLALLATLLPLMQMPVRATQSLAAAPAALVPAMQPPVKLALAADPQLEQGLQLYQSDRFAEAAQVLQRVVDTAANNLQVRGIAANHLALAYQKLGQWQQAETVLADSLQRLQTHQGSSQLALVFAQNLNTQGRLQLARGESEAALKTWQAVTALYTAQRDEVGVAGSLINQAQALQALGLYQQALQQLDAVNQRLQSQPNSLLKATSLRSLGNALGVVGDLQQSQRVLTQSLTIAESLQSTQLMAETLLSLANTHQSLGEPQTAQTLYERVVQTASPTTRVQAQLNLFNLLLDTQPKSITLSRVTVLETELDRLPLSRATLYARINFAQSLARWLTQPESNREQTEKMMQGLAQQLATTVQQANTLGDARAAASALGTLGHLYEETQQWSAAQDLTQQALLRSQAIRADDLSYRWQWQLGRIFRAMGDTKQFSQQGQHQTLQAGAKSVSAPADVYQQAIAAYGEAVSTLQSLRTDLVAINPEVQFSFRDSVEPVYREFVSLLLRPEQGEAPQANLIQARNAIESLQLAELEDFFRQACLDGNPVQIDQVDRTAAVIYPIILPDRLEVIVSLPQQPLRHYATELSQASVNQTLRELRGQLTDFDSQGFLPLSQQVYNWLIRPLAADLAKTSVKTLVFVLDGPLRNLPMAALHDGKQFLVEQYQVALTPGLQLLAVNPLQRERLSVLTAGLSEARQGYNSLPNVATELAQIQKTVPSEVLLNESFTAKSLQAQVQASDRPIVHLATHGEFSSKAEDTYILTWDSRIDINQLSSLLKTQNSGRQDPIELLVLSACRTAVGDSRAALGLAGVAVRAGARSTIGTLWYVDDQATGSVMARFYQEFTQASITKAEALRRAQQTLLQNPQFQHPYYWAPYILVGNWL